MKPIKNTYSREEVENLIEDYTSKFLKMFTSSTLAVMEFNNNWKKENLYNYDKN